MRTSALQHIELHIAYRVGQKNDPFLTTSIYNAISTAKINYLLCANRREEITIYLHTNRTCLHRQTKNDVI